MKARTSGSIVVALALASCAVQAQAGDRQPGEGKTPKAMLEGVIHLGDDDVRFTTAKGQVVFVDPVVAPAAAGKAPVKPDLILITHSHGDHFQPAVLHEYAKLSPKAVLAGPADVVKLAREKSLQVEPVAPGQKHELAGIRFQTVPAFFSQGDSHPKRNQWVGYVLDLDGARYYVTGDTQPYPEMAKTQADVILPLLFGCGGNLDLAVEMATVSKARLVIPVHHSGQTKVVEAYRARLPKAVASAHFVDGKLVGAP